MQERRTEVEGVGRGADVCEGAPAPRLCRRQREGDLRGRRGPGGHAPEGGGGRSLQRSRGARPECARGEGRETVAVAVCAVRCGGGARLGGQLGGPEDGVRRLQQRPPPPGGRRRRRHGCRRGRGRGLSHRTSALRPAVAASAGHPLRPSEEGGGWCCAVVSDSDLVDPLDQEPSAPPMEREGGLSVTLGMAHCHPPVIRCGGHQPGDNVQRRNFWIM